MSSTITSDSRDASPHSQLSRLPLLAAILLVLAACNVFEGQTPEDPIPAGVLWSADQETGDLSQWYQDGCGGEFNSGGGISGITSEVAHSGNSSARLTIAKVNGNQGVRLFRWCESRQHAELYYSIWLYFPERFDTTANWWNVFQFKSKRPSGQNDPFFVLNVGNRSDGTMYPYLYDWQLRKSFDQDLTDIPVGRWVQVEAFYRSAGSETGRVTIWQDGIEIFDIDKVQTRYPDGDTQWSVNNYTSAISPDPATIYADDAVISRDRVGPQATTAENTNRAE